MVSFFPNEQLVVINWSHFKNVEILCEYTHSNINRMLEKMCQNWSTLLKGKSVSPCMTKEKSLRTLSILRFQNDSKMSFFIVETTPLPIHNRRNDLKLRENGV
jgi:hypothetical protein